MWQVEPMAALDGRSSKRFDTRMRFLLHGVFFTGAAMLCIQTVLAPSTTVFLHFFTGLFAFCAVQIHRDGWRSFFYAAPFITFAFMHLLNATWRGQPLELGLFDPDRASGLALVAQLAVTLVAIGDRLWPIRPTTSILNKSQRLARIFPVLVFGALCILVLKFNNAIPDVVAMSFFYLTPIVVAASLLGKTSGVWIVACVGLGFGTAVLSILNNNRSDLFALVLTGCVLAMIFARRGLTLWRLVLAYVVARLITAFSAVSLAVRPLRSTPDVMVSEAIARLFSIETLHTVVNPFHTHSATSVFAARQTGATGFYTPFFEGPPSSVLDRLTLLPQMDIVTGRLEPPPIPEWSTLWQAMVPSALPDFGQAKLTILSDQIVWDLGLRSRESLGRPLITSVAEAWALGGYPAVFVATVFVFTCWAVTYRVMQRWFGLRTVVQAYMSIVAIHAVFSPTLLSQTLTMLRFPLQILLLCVLADWAVRLLSPFLFHIRRSFFKGTPMKILYVGTKSGTSLQRAEASRRIGHSVTHVAPEQNLPRHWPLWLNRQGGAGIDFVVSRTLDQSIGQGLFDLVHVDSGEVIGPKSMTRLKHAAPVVSHYTGDNPYADPTPERRRWRLFLSALPEYDLTVTVKRDPDLRQQMRSKGARNPMAVWQAADEALHRPFDNDIPKIWSSDVAFVGTWMPGREGFMQSLVEAGVNLAIYGPRWQKAPNFGTLQPYVRGHYLAGRDYAAAIAGAQIALVVLNDRNNDTHTNRSIEIPALGTAMVARRTKAHQQLYVDGSEAVFFDTAQECAETCVRLLTRPEELQKIASAGQQRAKVNGYFNETLMAQIYAKALQARG